MPPTDPVLVVGAGPAGLAAAWELSRLERPALVCERDSTVGGLARTVEYRGFRFDIGGHRFFTKVPLVEAMWDEILGETFLHRPRLSRIHYGGKFFDYPLRPLNALAGLGPIEAVRILVSYLGAQLFPAREERNFEDWVSNRFGRRLYKLFFKTYTEKVWGMPCTEISADWAAQRIKNLDLAKAVRSALLGSAGRGKGVITTLIDSFHYPRLGPGMMWEHCVTALEERGIPTHLDAGVERIRHENGRVVAAEVAGRGEIPASHVISSMPLPALVRAMDPPAPAEVRAAAEALRYRDFLTVVLIVQRADVFPDNWIYIHAPEVQVGRVQNYKNWSPDMVPDASQTALGLEYFVQEGDELWAAADSDLVELGTREMAALGLVDPAEVEDGTVVRMPKAYPVYDDGYTERVAVIRHWLDGFDNLHTVGRNGQHRYNNQDHSMVTGVYAARNVAGGAFDVWDVNVEAEYHEEGEAKSTGGDRLVPGKTAPPELEAVVREAFARYDPVALGAALGATAALGLFLATAVLLARGGEPVGPTLSLLGNYLLGYDVSWAGAALGALEAAIAGFALGAAMAALINALVGMTETAIRRRFQLARTLDP